MFHLLSYDDLFYSHGADEKKKQSNPVMVLRKHAIHLFNGGYGDVSGAIKSKHYSVLLYCRDTKGRKMILKNTRLQGTLRDNLKSAMALCAKKEQPSKKIIAKPKQPVQVVTLDDGAASDEWTLWIEAKVVFKKVKEEEDDGDDEKESATVAEDECDESTTAKSDEWDVVAEK